MRSATALAFCLTIVLPCFSTACAQVAESGENGFQIRASREIDKPAGEVFAAFEKEIGQWWNSQHSWSGDAGNLRMDHERGALIEKLPDGGYCRHLEIVYYEPGKAMRLSGGLGPLQGLGLHGVMSVAVSEAGGKSRVELSYNVSGFLPGGLEQLAPVVDGVLNEQLDRFKRYCQTGSPEAEAEGGDGRDEALLGEGTKLENEVVDISCGECQFDLPGDGCDLAIRYRGKAMYVSGSNIDDHGDAHAEDGLCNAIRRARVTGIVRNGKLVVDKIEVLKQVNASSRR